MPTHSLAIVAAMSLSLTGQIAAGHTPSSHRGGLVIETVALTARGHNRAHGTVVLTYDAGRKITTAALSLRGLVAGAPYAARVEAGRCGAESRSLHWLPSFRAHGHGAGTSATRFRGAYLHRAWSIVVYRGDTAPARLRSGVVACGNVF